MKKLALAVLGGMGPEASVYLYQRLINLSIEKYGAKENNDFPEIILYSIPVVDFISNVHQRENALTMLQDRIVSLHGAKISCFSLACNTAHLLLNDLQVKTEVPFVSMIAAVVNEVVKKRMKKVGILGSPCTTQSTLYQAPLHLRGIAVVEPDLLQQKILEQVIRSVIAGQAGEKERQALIKIGDALCKKGAEGIILGCTELPLVFPANFSVPVFNSVELLALALLQKYYGYSVE